MARWLDFEKLIARIYQTISPRALVKHNDSIQGIDSGIERQIDVSIRFAEAGCNFLIVVQAKNYKNPADVNVVGEFATVVKDVRASKGVLVCNAGFSKGAQKLASSRGIDLCSAHDAETKDWQTVLTIPIIWENLIPYLNFTFKAYLEVGDSISANPLEWVLSSDNGKTRIDIISTFVRLWNSNKISREAEKVHSIIMQNETNLKVLVRPNKWQVVDEFKFTYFVERNLYRKDVTTEEFTGLRNYITGHLEIEMLGVRLPPLNPNDGWSQLEENLEQFLSKEALVITVEEPIIQSKQFSAGNTSIVELLGDQ